jgi:hypothetical protein
MLVTVEVAVMPARRMDIVRKDSVSAKTGMQVRLMAGAFWQRWHQHRPKGEAIPVLQEGLD